MTTKTRTDPRKKFAPRFLPWILAGAAFALYWFTLNPWVSMFPCGVVALNPPVFMNSLLFTAKIAGWSWQPDYFSPLAFLATYPFRWLPAAQIPLALNLFAAVCAASTLGLLARSVALLPHDRTDAQRRREHSDFSFLTIGSAWLPPVLAVLVCGLQLRFWEQATNWTGEMFDLLLFAFVIWSLLEYRLDNREWRLLLASAVYGAGMAENGALVGFFPLFMAAVIWICGFSFFNLRFLKRMALCGLLGMAFFLLLPLVGLISGKLPVSFWQVLKFSLIPQYNILQDYFFCCLHPPRYLEFLALLGAYLIPLLVMAIRWQSGFGDRSPIGLALTSFLFHLASATFLLLCVWMAFEPPFSPRHVGFGMPYLTFYYLGALSIGYFSGYFLLVFGKESSRPFPMQLPPVFKYVNPLVVAGIWALAAVATSGLIYRNLPQIRAINDDTFRKYTSMMEANLPRSDAILLSDDQWRLYFMQTALTQDGRAKDFVLVDTQALPLPAYVRFLHNLYPRRWPELVAPKATRPIDPLGVLGVLNMMARTNELYYLHPSFGYLFEQFYPEPHGLIYKLKTLPQDSLLPPPLDKNLLAANEAFWSHAATQAFAPIKRAVAPPNPNAPRSWGERRLKRFHVPREPDQNAIVAGTLYSLSLDFWGVQLQRADELEKAAAAFTLAQELNPDNVVAQINLEFNQNLRAGRSVPVELSKVTRDQFGKYHDWNEVLNANGPFDEPSFCLAEALMLASQGGLFRQAAAPLARVCKLAPDNLNARHWLSRIYVACHLPDRALEVLREPLEQPERFGLAKTDLTDLDIIAATACFQKNDSARAAHLLDTEIALHPNDTNLLINVVQSYLANGLSTNALGIIDRQLKLAPNDPLWLFNRGNVCLQLKAYDDAIAAFTRVLATLTNSPTVLFNRALARLDSGKLDAARADYQTLRQSFTNAFQFQVAWGLGEVAWRQHNTNEAIRNYKLYLANANTNTTEATNVMQRLRELKGHSP